MIHATYYCERSGWAERVFTDDLQNSRGPGPPPPRSVAKSPLFRTLILIANGRFYGLLRKWRSGVPRPAPNCHFMKPKHLGSFARAKYD